MTLMVLFMLYLFVFFIVISANKECETVWMYLQNLYVKVEKCFF